jgi:hypothetical protein
MGSGDEGDGRYDVILCRLSNHTGSARKITTNGARNGVGTGCPPYFMADILCPLSLPEFPNAANENEALASAPSQFVVKFQKFNS